MSNSDSPEQPSTPTNLHDQDSNLADTAKPSASAVPETNRTNEVGVLTNRVPDVISFEEIPTARLIIRRDRNTHFEQIGLGIEKMRVDGKGYDCVVLCGKEKVMAHRCVLAAHSEHFEKTLFENGDRFMVDVPADGVPERGMSALLDYMYNGNLDINFENAVDTLASANMLKMHEMTNKCSEFVDTLFADENLMTTLELAERTGVDHLYGEAYKKLARNFYVQTKVQGFLEWDIEKVACLMRNDHIVIETEVHVFTSAMRWIQYRPDDRRVHFKRLMDCVRWVYMSTEEIMKCIDQEPGLLKHKDVRELLVDASWYRTLKGYSYIWKDYLIPLPRIRALRKEDPNVVVERVRASLESKHSSFDVIWDPRRRKTEFGETKNSITPEAAVKPTRRAPDSVDVLKENPEYRQRQLRQRTSGSNKEHIVRRRIKTENRRSIQPTKQPERTVFAKLNPFLSFFKRKEKPA